MDDISALLYTHSVVWQQNQKDVSNSTKRMCIVLKWKWSRRVGGDEVLFSQNKEEGRKINSATHTCLTIISWETCHCGPVGRCQVVLLYSLCGPRASFISEWWDTAHYPTIRLGDSTDPGSNLISLGHTIHAILSRSHFRHFSHIICHTLLIHRKRGGREI